MDTSVTDFGTALEVFQAQALAFRILDSSVGWRVGYHRVSDDSVSSGWWNPGELRDKQIQGLIQNPDIDSAWVRVGSDTGPAVILFGKG